MSGTKAGGRKAAITNKAKHGDDFYRNIGRKGGSVSHPETRPFSMNPEAASIAGAKGGRISSRAGVKNKKPRTAKKESPTEEKKGILGWLLGRKGK